MPVITCRILRDYCFTNLFLGCYSYDSLRVTSHTLDALASGPTVCAELAVELAQAGPQFTQVHTVPLMVKSWHVCTHLIQMLLRAYYI